MSQQPHILIIIPRLFGGGAERLVIDLATSLQPKGYQVTLCCLKETEAKYVYLYNELKLAGVKVYTLGQNKKINLLTLWRLWRFILKIKPDLIHTNLFGADILGTIAGRLAGVKRIVSTELNLNFSEGKFRMLSKRWTAPFRTRVVAVSQAVKSYAIAYEGVRADKISVIYNGVEIQPLNEVRPNAELIIGATGRLTPQKNFSLLIQALALVKNLNVSCEIAGEGEEKVMLQKLINQLGLSSRVKLVGWQKDLRSFFNKIVLVVSTSLWEGNSIALLAAGEAGLPVVVSDITSNREIIDNEKDGLLFNVSKPDELAIILDRLVADPMLRQKLGNNLRAKIVQDFSLNKMIDNYCAVYEKLL